MARHRAEVEQVPKAEVLAGIAERAEVRAAEKNAYRPEDDQVTVDDEKTRMVEGLEAEGWVSGPGFNAVCSCGWAANNPMATEALAQTVADAHEDSYYGGEQ